MKGETAPRFFIVYVVSSDKCILCMYIVSLLISTNVELERDSGRERQSPRRASSSARDAEKLGGRRTLALLLTIGGLLAVASAVAATAAKKARSQAPVG
mgnify:CR=1 FL=1